MDKLLQAKQVLLKLGIPLVILVLILGFIFLGINKQDKKIDIENDPKLSLFNEDELVATRYTDSIEDKLNIAVSSQDSIKNENEKMKKELDALKQLILKKEENEKNLQNKNNNSNLYNSYPPKYPKFIR